MLNPISDAGVESIFTTASSPIVSLQTSTPIMTPSIIATVTTSSDAPIPPTPIPSEVFQNLPTFNSVFRFDERLKSLEITFSEYRQTNPFVDAVSAIPVIVHQYMTQQMTKAALVDAYEADKTIIESYGESAILKRRRKVDDDQEGPSTGSDRGSKRQREGREHASASTPSKTATGSAGRSTTGSQSRQLSTNEYAFAEEPVQTTCQMEEPLHSVFKTATQGNAQSWIRELARQTDARSSFNELLDTPIDFFNFIMNRLNVDTLTLELLAGPTFELIRGSCNSLTELEYHLEEVYKATTDQLDWVNPEGQQYPPNLLQPLPLIPDNQGRRVIPFAHFINNNLDYLRYKAMTDQLDWVNPEGQQYPPNLLLPLPLIPDNQGRRIEDLVPRTMWIQEPLNYDKYALWGVSHLGRKRQQFYGYAVNRESALDEYSKQRIIAVIELKIVEWHNYKHLDWISVRRDDDKIHKFKEGDFKRLRLQDIKDMLLLLDRAAAMIQAIDKMLKSRRIMRSLEKFVGGL
nr:hypothetical protein [Tanacetum cinerariifolium]